MLIRGEFICGDGTVLPNNISLEGARVMLAAAFQDTAPEFYLGLVTGVPSDSMTMATMVEPAIGANGYARVNIPRTPIGWPTEGVLNGARFIESDWAVFNAVGGNFTESFLRIALLPTLTLVPNQPVYALSSALASPRLITPTTGLAERRFRYRVYL